MQVQESNEIAAKLSHLQTNLAALKSVIIAYSGGVDSAFLAYQARLILKSNALVVIAKSASLAEDDLIAARKQAQMFDWDLLEIETDETAKAEYQKNDQKRCYYCKATLFEAMEKLAREKGVKNLAYGANASDLSDFRPGHIAASEYCVLSPLQEVGLVKEEIRYLAQKAGLPSWDLPQNACLASRLPTFETVTIEKLALVEKAERIVRNFGFKQLRVRHSNDMASVEVDQNELQRFANEPELAAKIQNALCDLGYKEVVIDQRGYRTGSVNGKNNAK